MIPREIHGPDRATERSGAQVLRDVRSLPQQLGEILRSSFVGFLIAGLGGVAIFFPVIIDLAVPISLILAMIALLSPVVLPLRLPKFANRKDRNSPSPEDRRARPAAGIIFIGHHYRTGQQVWITNEDGRQHVVVPGTTGAGKTRALLSLMVNALIHGSGFIFVDGKADNGLYADVLALARRFGREDDVLVLNFLVASGDKATSTFNPFAFCNADVLRELLVSQMEESPSIPGGDTNGVFKAGAIALLGSLAPVLVWVRDNKGIPIDIERIRFATELRGIATLVVKKKFLIRDPDNSEPISIDVSDMPEDYFYPLRAYLGETGDFDFGLDWNKQKTNEPSRQHSFVLLYFRETFTQLSVSLGHIFKCEVGDIDMRDVVLNRRILVVNLPSLENSGETTAALGKIVIASLRNMMAQTLGAKLEGDFKEIVANKPSMSATPFPVVLDEVGYYAGPGIDKMLAQGRSLGFSFYLGFQEVAGLRARLGDTVFSLLGNANLQILMRLQEGGQTRDYVESTAGDTFVTQTGSFNQIGSGYRESLSADLRQTNRINWNDLRGLIEGEAIVLFGKHRIYTKLFYVDPNASGVLRLNRPITLLPPDRARLIDEKTRLDIAAGLFRDGEKLAVPVRRFKALDALLKGINDALATGKGTVSEDLAETALAALQGVAMDGTAMTPELSDVLVLPKSRASGGRFQGGRTSGSAGKQHDPVSADVSHTSLSKTCEDYSAANAQEHQTTEAGEKASGPSGKADGDATVEVDIRETRAQAAANVEEPRGSSLIPLTPEAFRETIAQLIDVLQQI